MVVDMNHKLSLLLFLTLVTSILVVGDVFRTPKAESSTSLSTDVGGYISENTDWTLDESPYVVVSDVVVEAGIVLTIKPGVDVRFTDATNLVIDGALVAEGNVTHNVRFTSNSTNPSPNDWGGIRFRDSSNDSLCRIVYGIVQYGTTGIYMEFSAPRIFRCNVSQCGGEGIFLGGKSFPTIEECCISNNGIGVRIQSDESPVAIIGNKITNNTGDGILCSWDWAMSTDISNNVISFNGGNGITCSVSYRIMISSNTLTNNSGKGIFLEYGGDCSVLNNTIEGNQYGIFGSVSPTHFNRICGNAVYDFYNTGGGTPNATYNWWGTANETIIQMHIYDYYDDYNLGKIFYKPFLLSPFFIPVDDEIFYIDISSNSTIGNFRFDQSKKQTNFEVSGESGTVGYCNVTIRQILLNATEAEWVILINDTPAITDPIIASNGTHTFIYFTYTLASTNYIVIQGTSAIPEFASILILPAFMLATLAVVLVWKKKRLKSS